MKIAVCEDEKVFADILAERISHHFGRQNEQPEIITYSDGAPLVRDIEGGVCFDIIFLDIRLEGSDGVDAAAELRLTDRRVPIVFVTSMEDRAPDGYAVSAFDFIVKSTLDEKLDKVLDRFMAERQNNRLTVEDIGGKVTVLSYGDILWAESDRRNSVIHTADSDISLPMSIGELAALLPEDMFIETYRAIYVQTAQIKRIDKDVLEMSDGKMLPLGRRRRNAVLAAVMNTVRRR